MGSDGVSCIPEHRRDEGEQETIVAPDTEDCIFNEEKSLPQETQTYEEGNETQIITHLDKMEKLRSTKKPKNKLSNLLKDGIKQFKPHMQSK